jgi:hypothetical protein
MVAKTVRDAILARPGWDIEVIGFFDRFVGGRFNRLIQTAPPGTRSSTAKFYHVTQKIGETTGCSAT